MDVKGEGRVCGRTENRLGKPQENQSAGKVGIEVNTRPSSELYSITGNDHQLTYKSVDPTRPLAASSLRAFLFGRA